MEYNQYTEFVCEGFGYNAKKASKENKIDLERPFGELVSNDRRTNIFAKIFNFSNEDIHSPGKLSSENFCYFGLCNIFLKIYPNGSSAEHKGYLSLFIEINKINEVFNFNSKLFSTSEISFVISVQDVYRNLRFSQSLAFSNDSLAKSNGTLSSGFDRFLARKTLLSEESELLHRDTLIIYFYINDIIVFQEDCYSIFTDNLFESSVVYETSESKLSLNSILVKILSQHSEFFERLLQIPMQEKETGFIELGSEKCFHLKNIGLMLMRVWQPFNISELCGMYRTAHMYGITAALEMCRKFMINILSHENIDTIASIASRYEDRYLKEVTEKFKMTNNVSGGADRDDVLCSDERLVKNKLLGANYASYMNILKEENIYDTNSDFNFYK